MCEIHGMHSGKCPQCKSDPTFAFLGGCLDYSITERGEILTSTESDYTVTLKTDRGSRKVQIELKGDFTLESWKSLAKWIGEKMGDDDE